MKPILKNALELLKQLASSVHLTFRAFGTLTILTICFFIALGFAGFAQSKIGEDTMFAMKGVTPSVQSQFFIDMIDMELPKTEKENTSTFSQGNVAHFMFRMLTDVNPNDLKSLIAGELPILHEDMRLLSQNRGLQSEDERSHVPDDEQPILDEESKNQVDIETEFPQNNKPDDSPVMTSGSKVMFIYHSHNRESWYPELKKAGLSSSSAYHSKINITLLGKRLANQLEDKGIGAISSEKDYPSEVKNYGWEYSYKYSLKTVQEAFAVFPDLNYYFDIHRDSQERELTTAKINGKDYAQLYFIIGHRNPNWEKNEQFAQKIHELLDERYPGISRGLWGKGPQSGNAEYNQSFSPNSILVEVGGPENTLEESYRTMDVLAEVIADIYREANKVNTQAVTAKK